MAAGLNILLVEDNNDHAELITRTLSQAFVHAKFKHTMRSAECLNLIQKKRFNLILMDYYLSDGTGIQLLHQVKSLRPDIPVIIITGQGDERTAAKSIKAGADDYVVKNRESLEVLPKIITQTLQKHKSHQNTKKRLASIKKTKKHRTLRGLFQEFEQISRSLKSIYARLNGKTQKKPSPQGELKKLPLLEKKMVGLKNIMRKLFLASE